MSYEELKNTLVNSLLKKGFIQSDDTFTKQQTIKTGEMIVNGRTIEQTSNESIRLEILGEGSLEDTPMIGVGIYVNDHHVCDQWIAYEEDIQKIF